MKLNSTGVRQGVNSFMMAHYFEESCPGDPMRRIETSSVHAGRGDFAELGVHASPIDLSTTYPVHDLAQGTASFDALVGGAASASNPIYARLHNPTVARTEQAIAELEGTEACVAFGSGMAALSALLLARRADGSHVLVVRPIYGSSDHLLACGTLGLEAEFVGADEIASRLRPETSLIVVETPANPTLKLVDIRAVVAAAGDVPVMVDSTFATPVLQNPASLGARYVLHSATKFLGGHGDVIAGVVCCTDKDAMPLRQMRALTGGLLHPLGAYLLHRGLATLALRVERAQQNAIEIATRLAQHAAVSAVYFPGMKGCERADLVGTHSSAQMRGPGALMAMELHGGFAAAAAVMAEVRLITPAVSLGSVDSLIQHPAGLTHRVVDEDARAAHGITPGLLRLSVGIEHVNDIWADLDHALSVAVQSTSTELRSAA
jgi:methionine-gamma-lyase